jgi:hypothetical protein
MSELAIVLRYVRNAQQYFVRRTGRQRVDLAGDPRLGRSTPTKADRLITRIQSALKVNEENIDLPLHLSQSYCTAFFSNSAFK